MATPLSEIVNSTEPPQTETPTEVVEEAVEATGEEATEEEAAASTEAAIEAKAEEATEEVQSAPPADVQKQIDDLTSQVKAFQTKAQDEVRKRQALEQQQQEKPDAYTEPDKAIEQGVSEAKAEMWGAMRLMQENNQKALHDDYDEKFAAFEKLAQDNPVLLEQARQEFDPCAYIYETATNHAKLEEMGDLSTFESRIREDERKKAQTEFDAKTKELTEKAIDAAIPNTLSDVTAAGAAGGTPFTGKTPLTKIFNK